MSFKQLGIFASGVVVAGVGLSVWTLQHSGSKTKIADEAVVPAPEPVPAAATEEQRLVQLTPEKVAAAGFSMATAAAQPLRHEHLVPGRIQYDDRRHVVVRSATPGIVVRLLVRPGQQVQPGEVLLEMNSSVVGDARADVLQRTSELKVAEASSKWARETCEGQIGRAHV